MAILLNVFRSLSVGMSVRMGTEVISIQNGGGMLTSSIRRAHGMGRETDFNSQSHFKT